MKKNYGKILKTFREKKSLSQNQLAQLANVSSSSISQLEANLRTYALSSLVALSNALDVTPNDLLGIVPATENPKIELYKVYKSTSGLGVYEYCLVMPIKYHNKNIFSCILLEVPDNYTKSVLYLDNYEAFELEPTDIDPVTLSVYRNDTVFTLFFNSIGAYTNG